MRLAAILCFVLSGIAGLRAIVLVVLGIIVMQKPDSGIDIGVFLPRAVGMLLVPLVLLIIGLACWKKAKQTPASQG
jgi:hypothetical protein